MKIPCQPLAVNATHQLIWDTNQTTQRYMFEFDPSVIVECSAHTGQLHLNKCPSHLYWDPLSGSCTYKPVSRYLPIECLHTHCMNGGSCQLDTVTLQPVCTCLPGFEGTFCETNVNECASNPCKMNGDMKSVCVDLVGDYYCICENKFMDKVVTDS